MIQNLTTFADFYEHATAEIERSESIMKPRAVGNREVYADYMQREFRSAIAIDRVRTYVLGKFGAELTVGTSQRLLGDLIRVCGLTSNAAEALKLEDAMDRLEAAKPNAEATPVVAPQPSGPIGPSGFLGGEALADSLGVHLSRRDAFFKQLERERLKLGDENWQEVANRRANAPRYQYRADSPKLRELAQGYKSPKPD
jgi:hypothetical protein